MIRYVEKDWVSSRSYLEARLEMMELNMGADGSDFAFSVDFSQNRLFPCILFICEGLKKRSEFKLNGRSMLFCIKFGDCISKHRVFRSWRNLVPALRYRLFLGILENHLYLDSICGSRKEKKRRFKFIIVIYMATSSVLEISSNFHPRIGNKW